METDATGAGLALQITIALGAAKWHGLEGKGSGETWTLGSGREVRERWRAEEGEEEQEKVADRQGSGPSLAREENAVTNGSSKPAFPKPRSVRLRTGVPPRGIVINGQPNE